MSCNASTENALVVEGASKCYRIYNRPQHRLWQTLCLGKSQRFREFWALRDVSFEVARGEAVGILGRNGAGKSTLLQLIAGTLTPTEGKIYTRGRTAALLQLGAGFHPDYTGRENVYLSGSILGLRRAEIDERFDGIASFADIGSYMDQPVKTYSSGMYARLGFAVAMAVEPEILIVDEILAVGDLLFQQKCITRIRQMRDNGLTLLFVSHSVDNVKGLCEKGLLLKNGQQCFFGAAGQCADLYLGQMRTETNRKLPQKSAYPEPKNEQSKIVQQQAKGVLRHGTQEVRITEVRVLDDKGEESRTFSFGDRVHIEVYYRSDVTTKNLNVSYLIRDASGVDLTGTMTYDEGIELPQLSPGKQGAVRFSFQNRLRPGGFGISVAITEINREQPKKPLLYDQIDGVEAFTVLQESGRPIHYKFDSAVEVNVL